MNRNRIRRAMAVAALTAGAGLAAPLATAGPASAAWVDPRPFTQQMLNSFCTGNGAMYAYNTDGTVGGWYCRVGNGSSWWIRPGDVCARTYGQAFRFVTTNYYSPYGGYCARWL